MKSYPVRVCYNYKISFAYCVRYECQVSYYCRHYFIDKERSSEKLHDFPKVPKLFVEKASLHTGCSE